MASLVRPALLRRTALAAAARRSSAVPMTCLARQQQALRSTMLRDSVRVSAFHASSRSNLLPPGPQVIKGTVNDPAPIPEPSAAHGSYHWTFERLVAVGLVPLTVAPFATGSLNPVMDATLCALLVIHSHFGFQSILIDYLPNRRFPRSAKLSMWALNAITALVGIGLYEFETNDVGVTEAVKRIWKA